MTPSGVANRRRTAVVRRGCRDRVGAQRQQGGDRYGREGGGARDHGLPIDKRPTRPVGSSDGWTHVGRYRSAGPAPRPAGAECRSPADSGDAAGVGDYWLIRRLSARRRRDRHRRRSQDLRCGGLRIPARPASGEHPADDLVKDEEHDGRCEQRDESRKVDHDACGPVLWSTVVYNDRRQRNSRELRRFLLDRFQ
jgi:hypothetical protein